MQLKTEHLPNNAPVFPGNRRDAAAADLMDNSDQAGESVTLPETDAPSSLIATQQSERGAVCCAAGAAWLASVADIAYIRSRIT